MNQRNRFIALGFALLCGGASAAGPDEDVKKIPVDAIRNPEMQSYRAIWAGLDMFDKEHGLAPAVPEMHFRLLTNKSGAKCIGFCGGSSQRQIGADEPDFGLRIASDNDSIPLRVSPEGVFTVPRNQAAYDDKADLVLNRKKNSYRMWPEVRTPGLPENVRRLGDLRLECKVKVAIAKEEIPFILVAFVNSILLTTDWCMKGEFNDEKFKFGYMSEKPLLSATLVDGEHSLKLESSKHGYQVALGDRSWPDDALVQLEYAPAISEAEQAATSTTKR
jgi:hypothetical protein